LRAYAVYILTNHTGTLYTGVTGDLERRVWQHKQGHGSTFTRRHKMDRLLYYETFGLVTDAAAREKQIKRWLRARKIALIATMNPEWRDLAEDWYASKR
jgi:putative endonuclease